MHAVTCGRAGAHPTLLLSLLDIAGPRGALPSVLPLAERRLHRFYTEGARSLRGPQRSGALQLAAPRHRGWPLGADPSAMTSSRLCQKDKL
jgi:hypothetical protein